MPGKVNPVIPEVVNQVAFEVIGNDVTVSFAAEAGQLQLNAFEPIIAYSLFKSLSHMERACHVLADRCIDGIVANKARLAFIVEHSLAIVTALNPHIGYENATKVALVAHETGKTVRQTVIDLGLMSPDLLDLALDVSTMLGPSR
jgi:aspartate ammonia-lyase